jgi:Secretion system C-terminal sorting domain
MKKNLTFLFLLFIFSKSFSQNLGEYTYGTAASDEFLQSSIVQNDTILITIGGQKVNASDYGLWIQKINLNTMKVISEKTYTDSKYKSILASCIVTDNKGNLFVGGRLEIDNSTNQGFCAKIDKNGVLSWISTYADFDRTFSITLDKNAGIYLAGFYNRKAVMLYLDNAGNMQWKKIYSDFGRENLQKILITSDDKLLLIARGGAFAVGLQGFTVYKTEKNGNIIWQHSFETRDHQIHSLNSYNLLAKSIGTILLPNDDLIVASTEGSTGSAIYKIDSKGNLTWKREIKSVLYEEEYPYDIRLLPNNNYLITGEVYSYEIKARGFMTIVDSTGKSLYKKRYGTKSINNLFFQGFPLKNGNNLFLGVSLKDEITQLDAKIFITDEFLNTTTNRIEVEVLYDKNNNCQKEKSEQAIQSKWSIKTDDTNNELMDLGKNGKVVFSFENDTIQINLNNPDDKIWNICQPTQKLIKDKNITKKVITFLVKPIDNCAKPSISITQPDLVICRKNRYFVTISNESLYNSDELIAKITLDKDLELISASLPYTKNGNSILFSLDSLKSFDTKHIELITKLSCSAELSLTHRVKAELLPVSCLPTWTKAILSVDASCDNNFVTLMCKNIGNTDMDTPSKYELWTNQFATEKGVLFLKKGESKTFQLPKNGDTYHIECEQITGYTLSDRPSLTIENCGVNNTGIAKVGYGNAFRYDEAAPHIAYTQAMNSLGNPNKIEAISCSLGELHFTNDKNYLEYCARVRNTTGKTQDSIEFELTFQNAIDLSTFHIESSNREVTYQTAYNNKIYAKMKNLHLTDYSKDSTKADAFIRFKVKPDNNLEADSYFSDFYLEGKALFNGSEPLTLNPTYQKYSLKAYQENSKPFVNPYNMQFYGGKYSDYSDFVVKDSLDNCYLFMSTYSYSEKMKKMIIKTDKNGKIIWRKFFDLGVGENYLVKKGIVSSQNTIYFASIYYPPDLINSSYDYSIKLFEMDFEGNILAENEWKPTDGLYDGQVRDFIQTKDASILLSGYCYISNNNGYSKSNFLIKFDKKNNKSWVKTYLVDGLEIEGRRIKELKDGTFLVADRDDYHKRYELYYQRIKPDGTMIFSQGFSHVWDSVKTNTFSFVDAIPYDDGSIIFIGKSSKKVNDKYTYSPEIVKIDKNDKIAYVKQLEFGDSITFHLGSIVLSKDSNIILIGTYTKKSLLYENIGVALFDKYFNLISVKDYEIDGIQLIYDALILGNDTLLLWGNIKVAPTDGNLDCFLIRTGLNGKNTINTQQVNDSLPKITIFPNPSNTFLQVNLNTLEKNNTLEINIFDTLGKKVKTEKFDASDKINFDTSKLENGIYFLNVSSQNQNLTTKKFVVIH